MRIITVTVTVMVMVTVTIAVAVAVMVTITVTEISRVRPQRLPELVHDIFDDVWLPCVLACRLVSARVGKYRWKC